MPPPLTSDTPVILDQSTGEITHECAQRLVDIVKKHAPLMFYPMRGRLLNCDWDDLLQQVCIAVCRRDSEYMLLRDEDLIPVVKAFCRRCMWELLRDHSRWQRCGTADMGTFEPESRPDDPQERLEAREELTALLMRAESVVTDRIKLRVFEQVAICERSPRVVADEFNITRQQVYDYRSEVMEVLRKLGTEKTTNTS